MFLPLSAFAQEKPKGEPATKLEQFLSKKGNLIVKDSNSVGQITGQYGTTVDIEALVIYEPGKESERIRGLRIEVHGGGRLERSEISFLDMDEVESLSQAISYMVRILEKWRGTSREYTEVIFSTRGDFQLGFYQKGTSVSAFAKSGIIGAATCFFPTGELLRFKTLIDKGVSVLR
jgi:hypothetical protein